MMSNFAHLAQYKKDIRKLGSIQRRATMLILELKKKSYENRLKDLNMFSLEKRKLGGDPIERNKIIKYFDSLDKDILFKIKGYLPHNPKHSLETQGKPFKTE